MEFIVRSRILLSEVVSVPFLRSVRLLQEVVCYGANTFFVSCCISSPLDIYLILRMYAPFGRVAFSELLSNLIE